MCFGNFFVVVCCNRESIIQYNGTSGCVSDILYAYWTLEDILYMTDLRLISSEIIQPVDLLTEKLKKE